MELKDWKYNGQPPIIYTIENNNGIYKINKPISINGYIGFIRIIRLEPINKEINYNNLDDILIDDVLIKGEKMKIQTCYSAYNLPITIKEKVITVFLNNTDDIDIKLIENSKIEVMLFYYNPIKKIRDLSKINNMREIKIMYWNGTELITDFYVTSKGELISLENGNFVGTTNLENVMEYIGKPDIDGDGIYSGHIVKMQYRDLSWNEKSNFIVKWSNTSSAFVLESVNKTNGESLTMPINFPLHTRLKIIGNIYQNPDLANHTEN